VIKHIRRLHLCIVVLLEQIPTLISVTLWRVCELDGGHEWGDWHDSDADLGPLVALRECRSCGAIQARGHRPTAAPSSFVVPLNLN
jgi:hypothetical protein